MRGCAAYDCFGAGQHVVQVTMAGVDWRESPDTAERMFGVFGMMRQLHELAWYLTEALALATARPVRTELRAALDEMKSLAAQPAEALLAADLAGRREAIGILLGKASELARAGVEGGPRRRERDRRGADLAGADLARPGPAGHEPTRDVDDRRGPPAGRSAGLADLAGADLRGADIRGADLRGALFVTRSQLETATGDAATRLAPPARTAGPLARVARIPRGGRPVRVARCGSPVHGPVCRAGHMPPPLQELRNRTSDPAHFGHIVT